MPHSPAREREPEAVTKGGAKAKAGRRLGIIAGGGAIPPAVGAAALKTYEQVFFVGLEGHAGDAIRRFPHAYAGIGQVGRVMRLLRDAACDDVVLVGHLRRPNLWTLRPDAGTILRLPQILRLLRGGDDHVLTRVGRLFEAQGFRVLGAHEVAPELVAPAGCLSRARPSAADFEDIRRGAGIIDALGPHDVGQAVVVSRGLVLAIEAAEGTDAMLARCGDLHPWGIKGRSGVLVKAPKPGQNMRLDMPAVGPRTVEGAAKAGLRGIAVAAGRVLLAEQAELIDRADAEGLFLYGFSESESGAVAGGEEA